MGVCPGEARNSLPGDLSPRGLAAVDLPPQVPALTAGGPDPVGASVPSSDGRDGHCHRGA